MIDEMQKEFEYKFLSFEDNPDQGNYGERFVDAEPDELWDWFESKLKSEIAEACRQQREICARVFLGNARQPNDNMAIPELNFRISEIIKNAPSPLDEVK